MLWLTYAFKQAAYRKTVKDKKKKKRYIPHGIRSLHSIEKGSVDCCDCIQTADVITNYRGEKPESHAAQLYSPCDNPFTLPRCSDRQVISFCAQTMGNTYLR